MTVNQVVLTSRYYFFFEKNQTNTIKLFNAQEVPK